MSPTTDSPRRALTKPQWILLASTLVLVVVLVTVAVGLRGTPVTGGFSPTSSLVGHHVKGFTLDGLNGGTVSAPWEAGHPAVVIFFASYCGPCRHEMPKVAKYVSTHDTSPVKVVAVDAVDQRTAAQAMVRLDRVTFPVGFDPNGSVTTGIFGFATVPESVFVNAKGVVTDVYYGAIPETKLATGIAALKGA